MVEVCIMRRDDSLPEDLAAAQAPAACRRCVLDWSVPFKIDHRLGGPGVPDFPLVDWHVAYFDTEQCAPVPTYTPWPPLRDRRDFAWRFDRGTVSLEWLSERRRDPICRSWIRAANRNLDNLMGQSNEPETPRRLGDFEILRELGRGGMGIVYESRQVSLNRKVALKVLSGALVLTPKAVQRFHREAEAAGKLHHPHIVPVYATGEDRGMHFYAMELISGPSLNHVIKQLRVDRKSATKPPDDRADDDLAEPIANAPETPKHESTTPYVGEASPACLYLLGAAFNRFAWSMPPAGIDPIDNLPVHMDAEGGETHAKTCAEVVPSTRAGQHILNAGVMPFCSVRDTDAIALAQFQSVGRACTGTRGTLV
jgi:Protein kinase domain